MYMAQLNQVSEFPELLVATETTLRGLGCQALILENPVAQYSAERVFY